MRDKHSWVSALYLEIGCSVVTALVIDYLVFSRKGGKNEQLDRIEKKLDVLIGNHKA